MIAHLRNDKLLEFGDDKFFVASYVRIKLRGNPGINFPYEKFGGINEVIGPIMSFNTQKETLNINVFDCRHLESPCYERPNMMTISIYDIEDIKTMKPLKRRGRLIEHGKTDPALARRRQL